MNEEQKFLFDGAISDLVDYTMRNEKLSMQDAADVVYKSKLLEKMENPKTALYREGPVYLYGMLCEERGLKKIAI